MARNDAASLADDSNVMQLAQNRSAAIEERTRREVDRMRSEADAYAMETLARLKEELEHTLGVVSNGLGKLETDRAARVGANAAGENGAAPSGG